MIPGQSLKVAGLCDRQNHESRSGQNDLLSSHESSCIPCDLLTLLHSEGPKLHRVLALLSAKGLTSTSVPSDF